MGVGGSKIFAFVTIRKKPPKVKEERANGAAPFTSRRSHAAYLSCSVESSRCA